MFLFEYYCQGCSFLVLWIYLRILPALKYYDSQDLDEKLKLIGGAMKFLSKKLLGHEVFNSMVLSGLQNIFWKICKTLRLPLLHTYVHSPRKKKKFFQNIFFKVFCRFSQTAYQKNVLIITKVSYIRYILCQKDSRAPLLDSSRNKNNTVCEYVNLKNSIEEFQRSEVPFPVGILVHLNYPFKVKKVKKVLKLSII